MVDVHGPVRKSKLEKSVSILYLPKEWPTRFTKIGSKLGLCRSAPVTFGFAVMTMKWSLSLSFSCFAGISVVR